MCGCATGVCATCAGRDADRRGDEPALHSAANDLDFGDVPAGLPELSRVEERLMARVHAHVEVFVYRGHAHKYRGQVVNFLRDAGRVYRRLPRLPGELDVILVRPSNFNPEQPQVARQFGRDFWVRRSSVRAWLDFLVAHHPGYRDVVVDQDRLSRLPEDGSVADQLAIEETDPARVDEAVDEADDESDLVDEAAVPNLVAEDANLDLLREQLLRAVCRKEQPPLRATADDDDARRWPLRDLNSSQPLLSWAFPTLYPAGRPSLFPPG